MGALLAIALVATPANAHDWYPVECCSGLDCAPVEKSEVVRETMHADMMSLFGGAPPLAGGLRVTTQHGTAIVPPTLTPRESKDHRMHACIRAGKVICIFLPPGM